MSLCAVPASLPCSVQVGCCRFVMQCLCSVLCAGLQPCCGRMCGGCSTPGDALVASSTNTIWWQLHVSCVHGWLVGWCMYCLVQYTCTAWCLVHVHCAKAAHTQSSMVCITTVTDDQPRPACRSRVHVADCVAHLVCLAWTTHCVCMVACVHVWLACCRDAAGLQVCPLDQERVHACCHGAETPRGC
jgi:hypothetical protein